MHVSALWLYPVKGAAGIELRAWELDAFGLLHDRRWMVVDASGFVTQRTDSILGQLRPAIESDALVLRSARAGVCRLPLGGGTGEHVRVRVWADEVDAVDCGDAAAAFMAQHLGRTARIVHMPDSTLRQADPVYARTGARVSFADAFPLLIIGQASLEELNRRLVEPIEMIRFRPNVVVAGAAPHAEDTWRRVRIGSVDCDVVKPCARCVVPTIDPATGMAGREPTRTLAGYRKWERKVWFGQNAIHRAPGTLATGAAVVVLGAGEPEPPLAL